MQYIAINDDGDKFYFSNKEMTTRHREGGPAVEYADGYKAWYINGKPHREDGPAVILPNGYKAWYINGERYSEKEFNAKMNTYNGKEVIIDGKTYTLTLKD